MIDGMGCTPSCSQPGHPAICKLRGGCLLLLALVLVLLHCRGGHYQGHNQMKVPATGTDHHRSRLT